MIQVNITATEIDPSKRYVFILDSKVSAQQAEWIKDALADAGFRGLFLRGPIDIVDFDQVKGYIEPPK